MVDFWRFYFKHGLDLGVGMFRIGVFKLGFI